MAILVKTDGSETEVKPKNGQEFKLDELLSLIGNGCEMVQSVTLEDGSTMYLDEMSKMRPIQGTSRTKNKKATKLLSEAGGIPGDNILGNVVIIPNHRQNFRRRPYIVTEGAQRRELTNLLKSYKKAQ
jgi:hypothetical protein